MSSGKNGKRRLRYCDLVALGIVNNRVTLANWIRDLGFPPGQLTGPNTRTWSEGEIDNWLARRPVKPKAVKPPPRPRGRPRKITATTQALEKPGSG